jgi:hypothetical protein
MKCAIVDGSSNGAQHAEPAHVARALGEQRLLGLTHLCDPREYENIRGPFRGTDDVGRRSPGESTCELPKKPPSRMTDRDMWAATPSQAGAKTKDDGIRLAP